MSKLTAEQRRKLPLSDFGDPAARLFPIVDQSDVEDAASLIGKAKNPARVKARIIAIAKRKGFKLPASWKEASSKKSDSDDALNAETAIVYGANPGTAVKKLDNGNIGGYLVVFSTQDDPDLAGDFFTKSTDFGTHTTSDTYFDHGLDAKVAKSVLGPAELKIDDVGVWCEAQITKRDKYAKAIEKLAAAGKLGWSSGTAAHLVEKKQAPNAKSWEITKWPLGLDASLTPTPCEPRTSATPLKSYQAASLKDMMDDYDGEDDDEEEKDDPFDDFVFSSKPTIGAAISTKLMRSASNTCAQLLGGYALRPGEFAHVMSEVASVAVAMEADIPSEIGMRTISSWDSWDFGYKSDAGKALNTFKDAIMAGLVRSFNAGVDYLLTSGLINFDERKTLQSGFDTMLADLEIPDSIANRTISGTIGWISVKSTNSPDDAGEEEEGSSKSLAEETEMAVAAFPGLIERVTKLKGARASVNRELGANPRKVVEDALVHVDSVRDQLLELLEPIKREAAPDAQKALADFDLVAFDAAAAG